MVDAVKEDNFKDEDFEKFCAALKNPDVDISSLKEGVEKFGMGLFSDSQKEAFLKAVFPAPIKDGASEAEKLGLQNLHGIKNVLGTMQELQKAGKINDEQIKSFLTMTNPANGRNIMTTVALNTWAADFKLDRLSNKKGNTQLKTNLEEGAGDNSLKSLLEQQKTIMKDIQEMFGKLSPEVFAEVANTPDQTRDVNGNSIRQIRYRDLAQKSSLMREKIASITPQLQQLDLQQAARGNEDLSANTAEEALRVGGTQPSLNISAENPNSQNNDLATPTDEDEDKDKIANLTEANDDDTHGRNKNDFKFSGVREQDIIDYMFQSWFIDGTNKILETTFNLGGKFFDVLCGNYDKSPKSTFTAPRVAPTAPAPANSTPATAGSIPASNSASAINNVIPTAATQSMSAQIAQLGEQSAAPYLEIFHKMAGDSEKIFAIAKIIEKNIGKEASKWNTDIEIFNPILHKQLIANLNILYAKNPQTFKSRLNKLLKNPQVMRSAFNEGQIRFAARLAAIEFAAQNLGSGLERNANAPKKVGKATFVKVFEILQSAEQIHQAKENEYRLQNELKPTDELTEKQLKAINDGSVAEMLKYMEGTTNRAKNLENLLNQHYQEKNASQKMLLEQQIKQSRKDLADFYGQYLSGNGDIAPARQNNNTKNEEMNLHTAANVEISAQAIEKAANRNIAAADTEQQQKRKGNENRRSRFNQHPVNRGKNDKVAPKTLYELKKRKGRV